MTLGLARDKPAVDNEFGSMVVTLKTALNRAVAFKRFVDSLLDSDLTALGYSAAEITTMRAAATALYNLNQVATAQATQPAASDFFFDAKKAAGVLFPA